jgi:hypothetical protein
LVLLCDTNYLSCFWNNWSVFFFSRDYDASPTLSLSILNICDYTLTILLLVLGIRCSFSLHCFYNYAIESYYCLFKTKNLSTLIRAFPCEPSFMRNNFTFCWKFTACYYISASSSTKLSEIILTSMKVYNP